MTSNPDSIQAPLEDLEGDLESMTKDRDGTAENLLERDSQLEHMLIERDGHQYQAEGLGMKLEAVTRIRYMTVVEM